MPTGLFIVLEGPEGAGKTTLARALATRMREDGVEAVAVREPGGTPAAEALRQELLDPARRWDAETELLYMVTARADLVARVIRPALDAGRVVLSDRYDLSTVAYQGSGRGVLRAKIDWINRAATGGLVPDLTLVLDLDAATGLERKRASGKAPDRLEREPRDFHARVVATYLAATGAGVHHLDAGAPPERVLAAAWSWIVAARPETFRPRSE